MKTIAILSQKGGSGKTTLSVNLAAALAGRDKVLLVDTDPQASATRWAQQGKGLPFNLVALEAQEAARFANKLKAFSSAFDLAVIDTPPQMETTAMVVALLANLVLIPATPSPLDLWGAGRALALVDEARQEREGKPMAALVPSRVKVGTSLGRELPQALAALGEPVSPPLFDRVAVAEAVMAGQAVQDYQPNSPAAEEFKSLAAFVRRQLRKG